MKHLALLAMLIPALLAADAPKKAEDKKPKPVNTVCPVTDEPVDPKAATGAEAKMTTTDLMVRRASVEKKLEAIEESWIEASAALEEL